jgi:ubiquinone/menaquinone biosynthesis C-methylase UbiE
MADARSTGFAGDSVPRAYEQHMVRQLFEPWAGELLRRARPAEGLSVLDVASGPGTVARLAAALVGEAGRVVASDISASMIALAAAKPDEPGSAKVEYVECSADDLDVADAGFHLVLCQQGLQFFPNRLGAVREMHRVLAPGGAAYLSTWAAEAPLGLFGPITDAMRECGVSEPFPRAFDARSYAMGAGELRELLEAAGFGDVSVETVELDCVWETSADALATISGTPFGPILAALPLATGNAVRAFLLERLGSTHADAVTLRTASNIARAVK